MKTKEKVVKKKSQKDLGVEVVPDYGKMAKAIYVHSSRVNVPQVNAEGKDMAEYMTATTYTYGDRAIHFIEINYDFYKNGRGRSDLEQRWLLYRMTGNLFVPVRIERSLLPQSDKVLTLKDQQFDFESGSIVMKDGKIPYGFKIVLDIDEKGNMASVERQKSEALQSSGKVNGKPVIPEIGQPLYTDIGIRNIGIKPTFSIHSEGKCMRVWPNPNIYVPLPDRAYKYTPYEYKALYTYGYLSMVAGVGDLVGNLIIKASESMSGYDGQKDIYPPEVKEGEKPLPTQRPLPYKADPTYAKILLLRRKYMVFVTNIKKAKIKSSALLPTLNFNWEEYGQKFVGSCERMDQRGTNLAPEEYIKRYILNKNQSIKFVKSNGGLS